MLKSHHKNFNSSLINRQQYNYPSRINQKNNHNERFNNQGVFTNSYKNNQVIQNLGLQSKQHLPSNIQIKSLNIESNFQSSKQNNIRLNVINKQNQSERISIIANASFTISQLKRKIQTEFYQLNNKTIIIKLIEDSRGFIFSNNSLIGDHVSSNDTIYFSLHKQKEGNNMNLPSNLTDIFLTLRYVAKSTIKKMSQVKKSLSLKQVISQLISFGFWYSNSDIVIDLLKLLNQMLTKEQILLLQKGGGQILDGLILKLIYFWLFQMPSIQEIYPDVYEQILIFIQRLTQSNYFAAILKNNKIIKKISQISKSNQQNEHNKICLNIIRNINGKNRNMSAPTNIKFDYSSNMYDDQPFQSYNLDQTLQMLLGKQQQEKMKALQIFADSRNKLCIQASVRFDYYWKLINGLLNLRNFNEKKQLKFFVSTLEQINKNTSESRAAELLDKNLLKKIHDFLLQSPVQLHKFVIKYTKNCLSLVAKNGQLNIKKICDLFSSPYQQFLIVLCQSLQKNNEFHTTKGRGFGLMYINNIKDFIKLALKSQNSQISKPLIKILSNLSLDQQCRYQILNLKGIQIFVKLLQTNRQNGDIQRVCAKGLLNLAISSKQTKVKVLSQMTNIIQMYYRRQVDSVASGYIETILKSSKI